MPTARAVTALLNYCRALPHATEDVKWGEDLCFSVGAKMFAVFDRSGGSRVSFKTTPGTFAVLTGRPGITAAPYVGRYHWVLIEDVRQLPVAEIKDLLRESYDLVFGKLPARLRRTLGTR